MLVILATTTAIIVPRFNGSFAGLSVDQATAMLLTDLRYAQARAITQRRAVQLAVADDAPSRYQLLVESDAPWPYKGEFEGMASGPWLCARVAEEVAKIKCMPVEETMYRLSVNTCHLFDLVWA